LIGQFFGTLIGMNPKLNLISPFEALLSLSPEFDLYQDVRRHPRVLFEKQLTPPIVLVDKVPVWGFSVMRQAKDMGIPLVVCQEIPGANMQELLLLSLALEDRAGKYSWSERHKLLGFLEANSISITDEIMQAIEGRMMSDWEKQTNAFSGFSESLQNLVDQGFVDFKAAERNCLLPSAIFDQLIALREKLSHSERRIFLDLLREISLRDGLKPGETVTLCYSLLAEKKPVESAHEMRFPELCGMQKKFDAIAVSLKKSGITLSAPPYFEGEAWRIEFPFAGKKNFNKKLSALAAFEKHIDELSGLL